MASGVKEFTWDEALEITKKASLVEHCTVVGCKRPVAARGLCDGHYARLRRHGKVNDKIPLQRQSSVVNGSVQCSVKGCRRTQHGHGLCSGHYQQLKRTGKLSDNKPLNISRSSHTCWWPECMAPKYKNGFCGKHWERVKRWVVKQKP